MSSEFGEKQYTDLLRELLAKYDKGDGIRETRDGHCTVSCFGKQMRFDLTGGKLPLLTTKKVWYRGVVDELLWFMRGSTDVRELQRVNIHIWDKHSCREWLDSNGLKHVPTHNIGRGYGYQWRNVPGNDQLMEALRKLREDPFSRRNIVNAWNPCDLKEMALPPCHMSFQFYVDDDGKGLRVHMYQRSADVGLGLPFNIASYATLAHVMARYAEMEARELIISFGDMHMYEAHVDALRVQAMREPLASCPFKLQLEFDIDTTKIEDLKFEDFKVLDDGIESFTMQGGSLSKIKMPLV